MVDFAGLPVDCRFTVYLYSILYYIKALNKLYGFAVIVLCNSDISFMLLGGISLSVTMQWGICFL
jgi:hypothetical protein